jgi:dephospho-CoA kinase
LTQVQIGITGGIGSGKSLVCKIFQVLGIPVYDADSRAKDIMTTDGILIDSIKKEFGELSYRKDGTLDRKYLGDKVFNDEQKLAKLNALVHPRVAENYRSWVEAHGKHPYLLKEAALLFEAGSHHVLDKIIVVYAPEDVRVKRVLQRDFHRTTDQIRGIIAAQMSDQEKLSRADYIIHNDESQLVTTQVLELHQKFLSLSRG